MRHKTTKKDTSKKEYFEWCTLRFNELRRIVSDLSPVDKENESAAIASMIIIDIREKYLSNQNSVESTETKSE